MSMRIRNVLAAACTLAAFSVAAQQPEERVPSVVRKEEPPVSQQPARPSIPQLFANLAGTYGDVVLDGDTSFTVTGAVVRSKSTARPYVVAQTATNTSGSAFAVYATPIGVPILWAQGDGRVGIHTQAPAAKLHVKADSSVSEALRIETPNAAAFPTVFRDLLPSEGYGAGVLLNMPGNSMIRVGPSLQLGMTTFASVGSTGTAPLLLNAFNAQNVEVGAATHTTTGLVVRSKGQSTFAGNVSAGADNGSRISLDVAGLRPQLTLKSATGGSPYPAVSFTDELNNPIGHVTAAKNYGFYIQSDANYPIIFRAGTSGVDYMTITPAGDVGIGNYLTPSGAYKLEVAGNAHFTGTVTGGNIKAKYQDVAEWVPAISDLNAGTVVVLDPKVVNQVMPSSRPYDTTVAGVVSEQPGLLLGEESAEKEMIATTGRVKVKVDATSGPIAIGDLLVTGHKPGTAMKSQPVEVGGIQLHRPGTVVGKALEPLAGGEGEILVLLSLQ
jgi:hypothetical protein